MYSIEIIFKKNYHGVMPHQRGHTIWIRDEAFYLKLRKIALQWSIRDSKTWDVVQVVIELLNRVIDEEDLNIK